MKKKAEKLLFTVSEMTGSNIPEVSVPVAKGVDLKELTAGDDNPMFVTVDALIEGESKNGRYYDVDTIHSVAKQINEKRPDAYEGHLKNEERPYKTPTAKTIWIGAKVYEVDGKAHLFVKGYVLPYAKNLKTYLRAAKATGKKVAVSIYGQAKEVFDRVKRVNLVMDFNLESLDWARAGSEGINGLGYLTIAKEMTDDQNPKTILEMFEGFRSDLEEKIKAEAGGELITIQEMLGTKNVVSVIQEMADELREYQINEVLKAKVDNQQARKILHSLIVAEMKNSVYTKSVVSEMVDKVLTSETGQLIIKSSRGREIAPKETGTLQSTRSFTKII